MIFDEADRMLDMGFEKEMNQCLELIREKAVGRFRPASDDKKFWSDQLKINFVSATMNPKVESLGHRLMEEYVKVGFEHNEEKKESEDVVGSIPKQVQQFYMEIPVQYRLVYLLAFLYGHQSEKVIVFASTCETVNFLQTVFQKFDWNQCGRRVDQDEEAATSNTTPKQLLFNGNIHKLHGDMEQEARKKNYFAFDKEENSVLICTDVASRGLDFKHVAWIV
jgi:ATP-dependent RNA helicase DDX31/DBP7